MEGRGLDVLTLAYPLKKSNLKRMSFLQETPVIKKQNLLRKELSLIAYPLVGTLVFLF